MRQPLPLPQQLPHPHPHPPHPLAIRRHPPHHPLPHKWHPPPHQHPLLPLSWTQVWFPVRVMLFFTPPVPVQLLLMPDSLVQSHLTHPPLHPLPLHEIRDTDFRSEHPHKHIHTQHLISSLIPLIHSFIPILSHHCLAICFAAAFITSSSSSSRLYFPF